MYKWCFFSSYNLHSIAIWFVFCWVSECKQRWDTLIKMSRVSNVRSPLIQHQLSFIKCHQYRLNEMNLYHYEGFQKPQMNIVGKTNGQFSTENISFSYIHFICNLFISWKFNHFSKFSKFSKVRHTCSKIYWH